MRSFSKGGAIMKRHKVYLAFVLTGALLSITTGTAVAWQNKQECVRFYDAEAGSKNLICDKKSGNARTDCFDGVKGWLADRKAGCPSK
jgi:hypothetical protein